MNRKIFHYFEIAAKLATAKRDGRTYFFGAIGERSDGALVRSVNSPTVFPERKVHSEYRVCSKIDVGATLYVVRIRNDNGSFAMAKPCNSCQKVIQSKGVKRVYYSVDDNWIGVWDVWSGNEKVVSFR